MSAQLELLKEVTRRLEEDISQAKRLAIDLVESEQVNERVQVHLIEMTSSLMWLNHHVDKAESAARRAERRP